MYLFVKNDAEYRAMDIDGNPQHPAIVIEAGEMIGTAPLGFARKRNHSYERGLNGSYV